MVVLTGTMVALLMTASPASAQPSRDLALDHSTFFGGGVGARPNPPEDLAGVATPRGEVYVVGTSRSLDFPTTPGSYDPTYNGTFDNAFVAKFNPDGSLAWSTFLGGALGGQSAVGVAVAPTGEVYVTGSTSSADFPTTPGSAAGRALRTSPPPQGRSTPPTTAAARTASCSDSTAAASR